MLFFRLLLSISTLAIVSNGKEITPKTILQDEYEVCYDPGCLDAALDLRRAINFSVDPCKDFYQFACGKWITDNPVPTTGTRFGRPHVLYNRINGIIQDILTTPKEPEDPKPVSQVKEFYEECINSDKLESAGTELLVTFLSEIIGQQWPLLNPSGFDDSFDWIEAASSINRHTADNAIIAAFVYRNIMNSTLNIVWLDQPALGLPRIYLVRPSDFPEIIDAYKNYIISVALLLGTAEPIESLTKSVEDFVLFEMAIANATTPPEDRYETHLLHNPFPLNVYQEGVDQIDQELTIDFVRYLDLLLNPSNITLAEDEIVNVPGEMYYQKLIPILKSTPKRVIADYIGWKAIKNLISVTTNDMRNITAEFNRVLSGAEEAILQGRPEACAREANLAFGMAIGYKYVDVAFDRTGKTIVKEMAENIRTAFKELLNEALWMEESTKVEAHAKADFLLALMAYPDWLEEEQGLEEHYAGLELSGSLDAHFQNTLNIALWLNRKRHRSLRVLNTGEEWISDPAIVSAFYSPQHNSVTVPAGFLQPPFFGVNRPAHQNYGGIGVVIGHEITHGFDPQGSHFDKFGNAVDWWDNETHFRFEEKAQCMIDQYSNFYFPEVDLYINGKITVGENVADNGGLRESFRAYRKYIEKLGKEEGRLPSPDLEKLTPDQLFFISYANIRCESITPEGLRQMISSGPHSPHEYRVKGPIRNSLDFATVFSCPVDSDGMNPPPEEKCSVW